MTVSELTCLLAKFAPSTPVITSGFDESAYDDLQTVEEVWMRPNVRPIGHYGAHDEASEGETGAIKAVFLNF